MAVLGDGSAIFHVRARLTDGFGGGSSLLFSALGDATSKLSCWMEDYWISDNLLGRSCWCGLTADRIRPPRSIEVRSMVIT
jgi:hypothetical protein